MATSHWQEAVDDLNAAIAADGDHVDFFEARAQSFEALGNKAEALADYQVVVARGESADTRRAAEEKVHELRQE